MGQTNAGFDVDRLQDSLVVCIDVSVEDEEPTTVIWLEQVSVHPRRDSVCCNAAFGQVSSGAISQSKVMRRLYVIALFRIITARGMFKLQQLGGEGNALVNAQMCETAVRSWVEELDKKVTAWMLQR